MKFNKDQWENNSDRSTIQINIYFKILSLLKNTEYCKHAALSHIQIFIVKSNGLARVGS